MYKVFTCNRNSTKYWGFFGFFFALAILQLFHFCNSATSRSHVDLIFSEMVRKIVTI